MFYTCSVDSDDHSPRYSSDDTVKEWRDKFMPQKTQDEDEDSASEPPTKKRRRSGGKSAGEPPTKKRNDDSGGAVGTGDDYEWASKDLMESWAIERTQSSDVELTVRKDGLPSIFFSAQPVQAMAVREWENPAECLPLPTKLIASVRLTTHCSATYFQQVAMFVAMQIKLLSKISTVAIVITMHSSNSSEFGTTTQRSVYWFSDIPAP